MGLTTLLLDTIVLTTSFAGIRKFTGYSIHNKVNSYISNPVAKSISSGFFGIGEYVLSKGIAILHSIGEKKKGN